jgi:coenzyme F420-dependent glucose-6-phosphate dehydrogenase
VVDAYKAACSDLGKEPGTIIMQSGISWAATQEEVLRGARKWKPTQLPELYTKDIADQVDMQQRADAQMSDEEFAHEGFIATADPDEHVERVREIADLGADAVCLQLIGSADPMGTIRTYGETVLPKLRG